MDESENFKPLFSINEKDDRFDGVILLNYGTDKKTTAENCGLWWYIREWELSNKDDGVEKWHCLHGFAISKDTIRTLYNSK